jgi:ABC-type Na+ efflux pump permease subunit
MKKKRGKAMKNKKIVMYISIVVILLIILGLGYLVYINITGEKENNQIKEYIPQEEITEEQLRMTNIELFFLNKNTNLLEKVVKSIDARDLIENPEKKIIEELLKGTNNESSLVIIPESTKLNNISIDKGVLYLDFSKDFIEVEDIEIEKNIIESLKKTMSQLIEIKSIKILIEGQENMGFKDGGISFENEFIINN